MTRLADGPVELDARTIEITNAGKALFPDDGITKGDLVGYYRDVAETMLPHTRDRPATLHRFPDGIGADGFFQKDAAEHFPGWVRTVEVERRREGGTVRHVVCDDAATLVYLANQAAVTLHLSPARADDVDVPDVVVFDLDPPTGGDLSPVRAAARSLRDLLAAVGLTAFVQTTGSKGYHVVAPIAPRHPFDRVRAFARVVAEVVREEDPRRLTTEVRRAKRQGRVFLDTGRNGYAQTYVAPYAVRALPGAPVASPLDWDELSRVVPRGHTLRSLPRRLRQRSDPWAEMHEAAGDLAQAARSLDELRQGRG